MAGYKQHISFSGLLGVGYGAGAAFAMGFTPVQGFLAGCLTGIGGMLPDLDSESGKPVRELFGLIAATAPMVLMKRFLEWSGNPETAMAMAVVLYFSLRHGGAWVLGKLSVHRGMFHSIPALIIAAQLTFIGYSSDSVRVKLLMAVGIGLGFLSHLVLDEIYAVEWTGLRIKLNQFAGSALKLFGKSFGANFFTYGLLFFLTYVTLVDVGVLEQPTTESAPGFIRQALERGDAAIR